MVGMATFTIEVSMISSMEARPAVTTIITAARETPCGGGVGPAGAEEWDGGF